jgi:hypothetical protein
MFGSHKVKLEGELLDKVKQCAEACGYASVDEFVVHALEKEVNKVLPPVEGNRKEAAPGAWVYRVAWPHRFPRLWALLELMFQP